MCSPDGYFIFLCLAFVIGVLAPRSSWAAVNLVQAKGNWCSGCTSVSVTPTSTIASNHLLIAYALGCSVIQGGGNCTVTISDTANNTWSGPTTIDVSAHGKAYMWYSCASKSGSDTITMSNSSALDLHVHVYEVSGISTSNCLDAIGTNSGVKPPDVNASTTSAVVQSNEYVVAFFTDWDTNAAFTQGSGYTIQVQSRNATTGDSAFSEDSNATTGLSGKQTATMSIPNTSDTWLGIIGTFKAAPPGIQVSSRSDTLSDSRPSATSNHSVAFTVNNAIYGSSLSGSSTVSLTLPAGFTIPVGMDCGDVDAATTVQFSFNYPGCVATATAWGFLAAGSVITLVPPSGTGVYVPTSTQVTIKIGSNATVGQQGGHWITNPSSGGIYTISVGGTFNGSGNMLVSINSGVTVAATWRRVWLLRSMGLLPARALPSRIISIGPTALTSALTGPSREPVMRAFASYQTLPPRRIMDGMGISGR